MATYRQTRKALLLAYIVTYGLTIENLPYFDANSWKNLILPYWKYEPFDLDQLTDDECKTNFRLYRNDVYNLIDIFNVPERIECEKDKHNWFVTPLAPQGKRTPGLFKVEF